MYAGVIDPGCGGLCPVSTWDCGQGVHFEPRFSSPYYNAYAFNVVGGAMKITRCNTEVDYVRIPYQICVPGDPQDPNDPFNVPFAPFGGGPGGELGGYGGNGFSGSGPGGGPPLRFELGPPTDPNGTPLPYTCMFCSTGTAVSHSASPDYIHCVPVEAGSLSYGLPAVAAESVPSAAIELESEHGAAALGRPAPDFTLYAADGSPVALSSLRGHKVILVFGRTDCPHCLSKIPLLNRLESAEKGTVIFIALGTAPAAVPGFQQDYQIAFQVLADPTRRIGSVYGIRAVPEVFLVDAEGIILYAGPKQGPYIWKYLADSSRVGNLPDADVPDGPNGASETYSFVSDWNQDGLLDLYDLEILVSGWLNELEREPDDAACECR